MCVFMLGCVYTYMLVNMKANMNSKCPFVFVYYVNMLHDLYMNVSVLFIVYGQRACKSTSMSKISK